MAVTTIKLDSSVRDRLNEEARRDGVPVAKVLEAMLEDRARARRFAELRSALAATPVELRSGYASETDAWAEADADGLSGV